MRVVSHNANRPRQPRRGFSCAPMKVILEVKIDVQAVFDAPAGKMVVTLLTV
jgi:hypothetical protein